jgi:hypothetical protein
MVNVKSGIIWNVTAMFQAVMGRTLASMTTSTDLAGMKRNTRCWNSGVLILLTALGSAWTAAQVTPDADDERSGASSGPMDEIQVLGTRSLRTLRLEMQAARERVYDLFNSLNSDDDFDIHCRNVPRTGTRIPQRVCRPRYTDNATSDAGQEFVRAIVLDPNCNGMIAEESCLTANAIPRAQDAVSGVAIGDMRLALEVQRLTRESPAFRRAITEYLVVESRYEQARRAEGASFRASATIIDTVGTPSRRASRQDSPAPRPLELVAAALPWSESADVSPGEGWVKLRYTVRSDGTTADLRAVDVVPPGLDPSTAVAAVEAWRFEPAVADGVPVEWHHNLAVITFSRGEGAHEAWTEYAEAYEGVAGLIADRRYDEARAGNETMLIEFAFTLEEIGLALMQRAAIEHALGDPQAALRAIRAATEPEVRALADEEMRLALEHRFALELELGRAADALRTFERRSALGRISSRDPLARQAAALRQALSAPEASLEIQAQIDDSGRSEHVLHWSTFAVGDADGNADGLEVECHRRKADLPLEEEIEITIPASWGRCALFVAGQPGTTFTLYEFQTAIGE